MFFQVEIPIAKIGTDEDPLEDRYDWEVVYKAWWQAAELVYKVKLRGDGQEEKLNLPVVTEFRIYDGSEMTMCPGKGDDLILAIEILSFKDLVYDEFADSDDLQTQWDGLCQSVFDMWSNITDHEGNRVKLLPHWAKQWDKLKYDGTPLMESQHMKDAYGERVGTF